MSYTIYCHTNKINGKRYVGVTRQKPMARWGNGKHYERHSRFYADIQKYGWEEFSHDIIFSGLSKQEAASKEAYLIEKWKLTDPKHGYNFYGGGKIVERSEAAMQKLSAMNIGKDNPFYGCHHDSKTRKLMSEMKPKMRVRCLEDGKVYESVRAVERELKIDHSSVSDCIKGKAKTAGGFHWELAERSDK